MGYESPIPPVPSRDKELVLIENYKKDFLSQSNFKWYQVEAQRKVKIEHSLRMNHHRVEWWRNFTLGLIITGPLFVTPIGRLFFRRLSSGVPYYFRPKFVYTEKPEYAQAVNWHTNKRQFPLWILFSYAYTQWFTDYSQVDDEQFEKHVIQPVL